MLTFLYLLLFQILQHPTEKIAENCKKLQELWLPEADNIKDSCSRQVIGFITKGDVSFISGHGQSIGYIALSALKALVQNSQTDKLFVRNTHSRQYRLAKIDVICSNF